jgi:hypothetical protein
MSGGIVGTGRLYDEVGFENIQKQELELLEWNQTLVRN